MRNVAVGVIGYGYWGPNLTRNFDEISNATLVAVADRSEEQLARVKRKYPYVETVTDYRDLFRLGVEAVAIATPPSTHRTIAMDCLTHGVGVLVEKPMTLSIEDSMALIAAAEANKQVLMVGHTYEYHPIIRKIKDIIKSGDLGDIFYIDAMRVNLGLFQAKANVVWDLAPHDISALCYLLDEEPISVAVQGVDSVSDGLADLAYMSLRFPGGIHGHIQVSWLSPRKIRQTTIVGSKKMVIFDDVDPVEKLKIFDKGVNQSAPYTETLEEFHWSYRRGDVLIPHVEFKEPLRLEVQDFIDSVANKTRPVADGYSGLRAVKVLEMADKSLKNGGIPVAIEPSDFSKIKKVYSQ